MDILNIDIETYSRLDLKYAGVHKYAADKDFEILMIAYSFNLGEVKLIDLHNGEIDEQFSKWFKDPNVKKTAWNAVFEIVCLNRYEEFETPAEQWECTMVKSTMLNLPASLSLAGSVIGVKDLKDTAGKALIKLFCMPDKDGVRRMPKDHPIKYQQFKNYCIGDVKTEQQIGQKLSWFTPTERERETWLLDFKINLTGIKLDRDLLCQAIKIKKVVDDRLFAEAQVISGLDNPNSPKQLKEWVESKTGTTITSLTKENVAKLIEDYPEPDINRVLCIRQEMAKTSNNKYVAMAQCIMSDDMVRGLHQYYGASKTGRWAGRLIQTQNLTHTKFSKKDNNEQIEIARNYLKAGDIESIDLLYPNTANFLSKLIRTIIIPDSEDEELLVSDFSAIEARVTAWFADEAWRLEVFRGHGKIYEASGAQMFKIPIEQVVGDIRSKSKVAELALGFGGGYNAMVKMGAHSMGIPDEEIQPIVDLWREASPRIVSLWYSIERAAKQAIAEPGIIVKMPKLKLQVKRNSLFIQLPSGRCLVYPNVRLAEGRYSGRETIKFEGLHQITKKWCSQETYGGKLTENIVQGTARDLLADAMLRLDKIGFPLKMHVHDEVVGSVKKGTSIDEINKLMGTEIEWAPGLPLGAASFTTPYYIKD